MKCTNCGHELPENAKFCTKCGIHVDNISKETITAEEDSHIQDRYNSVTIKTAFVWKDQYTYISIVVAFVLAIIVGLAIKIHKNGEIDNKQNIELTESVKKNNDGIENDMTNDYSEDEEEIYENNNVISNEEDSSLDLENQVLTIKEQYNDIMKKINSNSFFVKNFSIGANAYYSDDIIRSIIIQKNAYNNPYAQYFYYDTDENLIFAYYESNDSNKLYFSNSKLIKWIYCEDVSDSENVVEYDYGDSEEFNNAQDMVINDSDFYINIVNEINEEAELNDDYVWPESDSKYMTKNDLKGFSKKDCWLARNELYARHGRKFDNEELQNYFNSKDWYNGIIAPNDFQESTLNDYEMHNRDLIVEYEKKKGYR